MSTALPAGDRHETPTVQADDALIDALAEGRTTDDTDLARLLAAWRGEVQAEPVVELVDTDRALTIVRGDRGVLGAAVAWACLAVVVLLLVVLAVRSVVIWLT